MPVERRAEEEAVISLPSLLLVVHLVGLALAVGAATVKVLLLLRSDADPERVRVYLAVARPVTRLIILGLVLLTLSGVGWLLLGHPLTARLVTKLVLVGAIWVLGPVIDNVVEPRFRSLAATAGGPDPAAFARVRRTYLSLELTATLLFYVIILVWVAG